MRIVPLALMMAAAACSKPPLVVEDHAPPQAVADVAGRVWDASGAVLAGTVTVQCAGPVGATVPISAEGLYHAALITSTHRQGESLSLPCVFTAPAGIRVERTIGFGPSGLPHALQIVDLRGA